MEVRGINHVSVSARDIDESLAFYTDFLGLERIPAPNFGIRVEWLRAGQTQIHLFEDHHPAPRGHHLALTTDNWQDRYLRARDLGCLVHEPPFQTTELPNGAAQMYLRDPAGNLVELDMPDASRLDRSLVEIRVLADAHPQSEENLSAALYLDTDTTDRP